MRRPPIENLGRWHATHKVQGQPVMKVAHWQGPYPAFFGEDGKQVRLGTGKKAYPIEGAAPCPDLDPNWKRGPRPDLNPPPEPEPPKPFEPTVSLNVEIAAAVLRASAWPSPNESCGFAETVSGDSVTVVGKGLVRVYDHFRREHYLLRVPAEVTFDAVPDEALEPV